MAKTEQERLGIAETEIDTLQKSDDDQWSAINNLRGKIDEMMRKWIPVWVAFLLMGASGITTAALTFAGMLIRMNSK